MAVCEAAWGRSSRCLGVAGLAGSLCFNGIINGESGRAARTDTPTSNSGTPSTEECENQIKELHTDRRQPLLGGTAGVWGGDFQS